MKFRTEIEQVAFPERIDYSSRILTIGSCFAQSIGEELRRAKFRAEVNPTGVLFNPLSIASTLDRLHQGRGVTPEELREGAMGWYHLDFHSSLSGATREEALLSINHAVERGREALVTSDWVIMTLGTAWLYERVDTGELVANCHREPARNFTRRRASHSEIVARLEELLGGALAGKRVIVTISPIRHMGDGLVENSLSKATLRVAIEELVSRHSERLFYLPSYEILLDDLRDYRFYERDMVHPSSVAIEYIWSYFRGAALSEQAERTIPQVERIVRAREHRPTAPESEAYREFCRSQIRAIEELQNIDLREEERYFRGFLE